MNFNVIYSELVQRDWNAPKERYKVAENESNKFRREKMAI